MSTRRGFPRNLKYILAAAMLVSLIYIPGDLSNRFLPAPKVHASSGEGNPLVRDLPPPTVATSLLLPYLAPTVAVKSPPPPYIGAAKGRAVLLKQQAAEGIFVPIRTSLPVFKSFGLSANSKLLLYTSLKNGAPSGELYVEDLATTRLQKVSSRLVLEAAWSPIDSAKIAYTFATGEGFGLAVRDLASGETRTLISEGVFTEAIQWDDSGNGIHYFAAAVENSRLHLTPGFVSVEGSAKLNSLAGSPAGFPALTEAASSGRGSPVFRAGKETSAKDQYAFRTASPDREHEVLGDSLLGNSALRTRSLSSGSIRDLGIGRVIKVLREGMVITRISPTGAELQYVNWSGKTIAATPTMVAYNLPLQSSIMTQGGAAYVSPGNCSLVAHGGVMEYAYDFEGAIGSHVLAAADGLVVYTISTVTCNTVEPSCPDYSPTGCPGTFLGNMIIVQHADGSYTKYAHLETGSVQVAVGTNVCQGFYIGRQGHTGSAGATFNNCGDHLHFQRQSSPDVFGQSLPVDFSDVPSNPLSCNTTYVSNSVEKSHSISPSSQSFEIAGGTGSVNLTSTGCSWTAISNNSWITITSPGNGTGNGLVSFAVADNSASGPRTGTMTLGGHLFTINQNGGGVTNQPPVVNAGSDQTITLPGSASLVGTATDDGLPNPPAATTGTWAMVSGPGTVSFGNGNLLNTTASFSIAGIYVLRLTVSDGALTSSDDITIVVNGNTGGSLSTSFGVPPPNINLTAEGTADWAHWGLATATSFNHKNGIAQQISDYTRIGTISAIRYGNSMISYSWADGTPMASANNTTTGIYAYGVGSGFQVTVPADTSARTLRLYVGLFAAQGKLEAFLSDGSASPYIDTSLVNQFGPTNRVYTLNYLAGSAGQTLTVRWSANTTFHPVGNVTLQAASLVNSGTFNQAPIVNAGSDQVITLPATAALSGTATDDGLPNPPGALVTTWSKVSGPGTVTFANANAPATNASFSTAGLYTLRLTADDGALPVSDDMDVTVNASSPSGSLTVSAGTPSAAINLTAEGNTDWAHWGLATATSFNHKNGVAQQISSFTQIGTVAPVRYANSLISYSWADGTPTSAASNTTTGVYVSGVNNGFQVTVPADTNARTLRLYVGVWRAQGKLEAFLSDGSASPYIDTSLMNQNGTTTNRVYTLNYLAGSAGQTLTVRWTANTTFISAGNVTLQAASLVTGGTFNQAPIVNAGSDQVITLPATAALSGTATDDGLPNPPGALVTTWSKVSGPGTVTFANANAPATNASFSTAGLYTLRLTADDGALPVSDDMDVTVNASSPSGSLTVSAGTPSAAINLTAEGNTDWAHWGLATATSFNHKNGVAQQISSFTQIGTVAPVRYANSLISYSWADGTPTSAASNTTTGVYVSGVNNGFQVTVPADTNARTLRLYVGVWRAQGKLEAFLSDGSASPYIDTSLMNQNGTTTNRVYTLNYLAGSAGQTLTVRWTANTTFISAGNVTLQAASLVTGGTFNQAPIVNAGSDQVITLPATAALSGTATDDGLPNPPGALVTTWSKVSGPGTVTFANANAPATNASFSTAGLYTLRLTADDGALPVSDDMDVTVNASSPSGSLTVSAGTPSAAINLTAEGNTDWAHWGLATATSFNHKNGVAQQISSFTQIGTVAPVRYANSLISYSWADGTPTSAASNTTTGVYVSGVNNGFQVTVPADTNARTLRLYVGVWRAQGKLEAFLSDGSASPYIDTSLMNQNGTTTNRVYTLNYLAGSAGQTLTVRWTANTTFISAGNVTLQAASQ